MPPAPSADDFVIVREEQSIDLPSMASDAPPREPSGDFQAINYRDASYSLEAQSLPGQRPTLDGLEIETTEISFGDEAPTQPAGGLELWGASPSDELYGSMDTEPPSAMSDALAEIDALVAKAPSDPPSVPASPWDVVDPFAAIPPAFPEAPLWHSPTAIPTSPAPSGASEAPPLTAMPWEMAAVPEEPAASLEERPEGTWQSAADATAYAPTDPSLAAIDEMLVETVRQPSEALAYEPVPEEPRAATPLHELKSHEPWGLAVPTEAPFVLSVSPSHPATLPIAPPIGAPPASPTAAPLTAAVAAPVDPRADTPTLFEISAAASSPMSVSPSDAIAASLERVAEQIRAGELVVGAEEAGSDGAALARALAALLGGRRG